MNDYTDEEKAFDQFINEIIITRNPGRQEPRIFLLKDIIRPSKEDDLFWKGPRLELKAGTIGRFDYQVQPMTEKEMGSIKASFHKIGYAEFSDYTHSNSDGVYLYIDEFDWVEPTGKVIDATTNRDSEGVEISISPELQNTHTEKEV